MRDNREMPEWSFLSNHARVLSCLARDPEVRLRDIATTLGITERSAHGIVADLAEAGYVLKEKAGRRNRYQIQAHLPLREATTRERTIGEVVTLLVGTDRRHQPAQKRVAPRAAPTSRIGPPVHDGSRRPKRRPA
jgi:DNA-binding Lrp family transcriptional regulator